MDNYDWSKFTQRIPVKAGPQKIYDAWATPAGLEKWFLRNAKFRKADGSPRDPNDLIQKDDTYEWNWFGYSDDTSEHGKIIAANGKDFFKFVFGKAGIVSVTIKTEENQTIVELLQEQIPTDEKSKVSFHLGCSTGWTFYLANLKSIYEGGLDLRNKDEKIKRVVNS
jgi:uncharacterized protein YndB with AHSA1/START domain